MTAPADAEGRRLDRVLREARPDLSYVAAQKLLREGRIRVDGAKAKANLRLTAGQVLTAPPPREGEEPRSSSPIDGDLVEALKSRIIRQDDAVLALDKPAGLATQGGSKTRRHVAGALPGLRLDGEETPRLVHRLDRDTSGVLLLARTRSAAEALAAAFKGRDVEKLYLALVVGGPDYKQGRIDLPLGKRPGPAGEKVVVDHEDGQPALTKWRRLSRGGGCALMALRPLTGRTHQLRAHCAAMGWPILGDGKHGGANAFLDGRSVGESLRLHARRITIPHPLSGRDVVYDADPPEAFLADMKALRIGAEALP